MQDHIAYCRNPFHWRKLHSYESAGIRVVTGYYNHSARICWLDGKQVVLEAIGPEGVLPPQPLGKWLVERLARGEIIHIVPAKVTLTEPQIWEQVNKEYDYGSLGWLAVYKLTGYWGGRKAIAAEKVYCFELTELTEGNPEFYCALPQESIFETERAAA